MKSISTGIHLGGTLNDSTGVRNEVETTQTSGIKVKMPTEVTKEGRFYSHLEDFIYNQHITDEIEEVLNHSVWKSDGKIYFQLSSLERYLRKIQFKEFSTTQMGSLIRDKGGDSKQMRINKNSVKNLFFIPDPKPQNEAKLDIPKVKDDVPF